MSYRKLSMVCIVFVFAALVLAQRECTAQNTRTVKDYIHSTVGVGVTHILQADNAVDTNKHRQQGNDKDKRNVDKDMHAVPTPVYFAYPPYGGYPPPFGYSPYYPPYYPPNSYDYPDIIMFNQQGDMALIWDPWTQSFKWLPIQPAVPGGLNRPPIIIYGPGGWNSDNQSAQAQNSNNYSAGIVVREAPNTPAVTGARTLTGEVVRVSPSAGSQTITIRSNGVAATYPLAPNAMILRNRTGRRGVEVSLGDVRPGDSVTIQLNDRGQVTTIRAQFSAITGKVDSISDGTILLDSGATAKLTDKTTVVLPGNFHGSQRDIHPGDTVTIRINPDNGAASLVRIITPKSLPANADSQITLNTVGPLRAGDALVVGFKGQAGGKADFSIPGIQNDIPMTEVTPGTYKGQYTVQPGDTLTSRPIVVKFIRSDGSIYAKSSPAMVTIKTISGYVPQIDYPHQGEEIRSPIIVRGISDPGATVRVMIDYRVNFRNVLPIDGTSDVQEVTADRGGMWQTKPMAAVVAFDEDSSKLPDYFGVISGLFNEDDQEPVVYTITATELGEDEQELASFSIDVTKVPGFSNTR
jgi:archaellin